MAVERITPPPDPGWRKMPQSEASPDGGLTRIHGLSGTTCQEGKSRAGRPLEPEPLKAGDTLTLYRRTK